MAYIGRNGVIKLQRNQPEPIVVPASAVNVNGNYVAVDFDDWFLGESVSLIHSSGVLSGFIHRDTLDRIYFHSTRNGALSNTAATRTPFTSVSVSKPVILVSSPSAAQVSVLTTFQATLTTLAVERRLRGWPETLAAFNAQATVNPWTLQGQLRSWTLNRSAPEIETGSLGDKFATYTKSVISGSGDLDFIVNLYSRDNYSDVDPMLRLVQLTEQGSEAQCCFYLKKTTTTNVRTDQTPYIVPVNAALFFSAKILITASSVNVAADDLIAGSASFVTTGPIRLLSEA